jgi:hypothetical protein
MAPQAIAAGSLEGMDASQNQAAQLDHAGNPRPGGHRVGLLAQGLLARLRLPNPHPRTAQHLLGRTGSKDSPTPTAASGNAERTAGCGPARPVVWGAPGRARRLPDRIYARGERSSRGIERECREDIAYRVLAANLVPDHSMVAEFRRRHETALAAVFTQVLGLCREAGLVTVGVIAVDGTKITVSASNDSDRDYEQIVREILEEAERLDSEEDELHGNARGDELPEHLQTAAGRKRALREAKQRLEREWREKRDLGRSDDDDDSDDGPGGELELVFDREVIERSGGRGRRRWFVEARQQLDQHHRKQARPVKRSRLGRLLPERAAVERAARG